MTEKFTLHNIPSDISDSLSQALKGSSLPKGINVYSLRGLPVKPQKPFIVISEGGFETNEMRTAFLKGANKCIPFTREEGELLKRLG